MISGTAGALRGLKLARPRPGRVVPALQIPAMRAIPGEGRERVRRAGLRLVEIEVDPGVLESFAEERVEPGASARLPGRRQVHVMQQLARRSDRSRPTARAVRTRPPAPAPAPPPAPPPRNCPSRARRKFASAYPLMLGSSLAVRNVASARPRAACAAAVGVGVVEAMPLAPDDVPPQHLAELEARWQASRRHQPGHLGIHRRHIVLRPACRTPHIELFSLPKPVAVVGGRPVRISLDPHRAAGGIVGRVDQLLRERDDRTPIPAALSAAK